MALDIAAIQERYGVNARHRTGDDAYVLPSANAAGAYWTCIWDAGGDDTIRAPDSSGSSLRCVIDLRAADLEGEGAGGYVSYFYTIVGGFTIANTVVIENAIGGAGNDTIIGNAADNRLTGGGGADTFVFRDDFGSDTITDFDVDNDIIRFVGFSEVVSLAQFIAASTQDGNDVVYDFGDDGINVLLLENVMLSELQTSNLRLDGVTPSSKALSSDAAEAGADTHLYRFDSGITPSGEILDFSVANDDRLLLLDNAPGDAAIDTLEELKAAFISSSYHDDTGLLELLFERPEQTGGDSQQRLSLTMSTAVDSALYDDNGELNDFDAFLEALGGEEALLFG